MAYEYDKDLDQYVQIVKTKGGGGSDMSFEVDSTETVDAGEDAEVTNEGDDEEIKLAFKIPKGEDGDNGDTPTVEVDSVETVDPDEDAEVENVGDDKNVKLKFKIPRGKDGEDADDD